MSDVTNIVRNSGDPLSFQYDGDEVNLPGHGDTTILPAGCAAFAARNYGHVGVQIVHPEAEAEARAAGEKQRAFDKLPADKREKVLAELEEAKLTAELGPVCTGTPEVTPGVEGDVPCTVRTKNASGLCQNCEAEVKRRPSVLEQAAAAQVEPTNPKEVGLESAKADAGATGGAAAPKKKATRRKK